MWIKNVRMLRRYAEIVCILIQVAALQPDYKMHRFQRMSEIADSMVEWKVLLAKSGNMGNTVSFLSFTETNISFRFGYGAALKYNFIPVWKTWYKQYWSSRYHDDVFTSCGPYLDHGVSTQKNKCKEWVEEKYSKACQMTKMRIITVETLTLTSSD